MRTPMRAPQGAQSKLRDLYEQAQESAGRTWVQLDSSFNLKGRAERAGKRAEEALRDVSGPQTPACAACRTPLPGCCGGTCEHAR